MRKHMLGVATLVALVLSLVGASSALADPPFPDYQVTALPGEVVTYDLAVVNPSLDVNQVIGSSGCSQTGLTSVEYAVPPTSPSGEVWTCTIQVIYGGGNFGIATFIVTTGSSEPPPDTTNPDVTITSPSNGTLLTENSVSVGFTVTDNDPSPVCKIADTVVTSPTTVGLSSGSNTITVTCTDTANNVGSDSVEVTYTPSPPVDNVNPEVNITSPVDGSTVNTNTVTLNYTATDNVDTSLDCSVADGSILTLNEGLNTFTVSCSDDAGNTGSDAVSVTYTPPPLTLTVSSGIGYEGDPGDATTYIVFQVTLNRPATQDINIGYWAEPGVIYPNGASCTDFDCNVLLPKSKTIPAGQTTTQIKVAIKNDNKAEGNEKMILLYLTCGAINTAGYQVGTIVEDDPRR